MNTQNSNKICANCKHWFLNPHIDVIDKMTVEGRCLVSDTFTRSDNVCNAWELSASYEQVKLPYATFDAGELQYRINELEIEKDNCLKWVKDLEARLYNFGVLYDEVVDENEEFQSRIAKLEEGWASDFQRLTVRISELEAFIEQLIKVGTDVSNACPMYNSQISKWDNLVKNWKKGELK